MCEFFENFQHCGIIVKDVLEERNMSEQEVLEEVKRIEEYVENCTPEEARQIMREAGIVNPDGTLTERYK